MGNNEEFRALLRQAEKLNQQISKLAGTQQEVSFGEFAKSYLKIKLANPTLRESTKRAFEFQLRCNLIPGFGALPIRALNNLVWIEWVKKTREAARTNRFFNARKCLMEILHAAMQDGHLERVPKIDNPDAVKKIGRVIEPREVWAILRNTTYPEFRLFFYVLYRMGCRPREILKWEWSMIRFQEPAETWIDIPARISKCDRDRSIPLDPKVSHQLYRIWKRGVSSPFVFPNRVHPNQPQLSYHGAWATSCKKAGIKAMPYDFRRSAITRWAAAGKSLPFMALVLDTSPGMINKIYLKPDKVAMENIFK